MLHNAAVVQSALYAVTSCSSMVWQQQEIIIQWLPFGECKMGCCLQFYLQCKTALGTRDSVHLTDCLGREAKGGIDGKTKQSFFSHSNLFCNLFILRECEASLCFCFYCWSSYPDCIYPIRTFTAVSFMISSFTVYFKNLVSFTVRDDLIEPAYEYVT